MCGLAKRSNILDIFGYGWDIDSGNIIPFLVTDFSTEGTLRRFLKNNPLSIHEKLLFCKDVAQGLHSLHVAGIAHGDLKLDNVLVTPHLESSNAPQERHLMRSSGYQACISDFGHSLHLYDDEGDDSVVKQRYGGTLAYNAPEILDRDRAAREHINFRKCDIWSLGLSCWEILIDGGAYYHTTDVEDCILSSSKRSDSYPTPPPSNPPSQASSASLVDELVKITPQLIDISCRQISGITNDTLTTRETSRLHQLFKQCLEPDPARRLADIPLLPFFHGQE
jgi:serine/threonine protein kinase